MTQIKSGMPNYISTSSPISQHISTMHMLLKYLSEVSNSHLARNTVHVLLSESSRIQLRKHSTQDILIKIKFMYSMKFFHDQDNLIVRVPKGYITLDPDLIKIIKMNFKSAAHKSAQI